MKKFIAIILTIGIISSGSYFFFQKSKVQEPKTKIERQATPLPKEVTIFDLSSEKADLNLTKPGIIKTDNIAYISPQINGRVTDIYVKVGDNVKESQPLLELGDSLSTDLIDLNYESSGQAALLAEEGKLATENINLINTQTAETSIKNAYEAYLNSLNTLRNTEETLSTQYESTKLAVDSAEISQKSAKQNYKNAKEALEDLEDAYDEDSENSISEAAIDNAERQVKSAKTAMEVAANQLEQAQQGLEIFKTTSYGQLDQLNFATTLSFNQYENALNQLNSVQAGAILQEIGSANNNLQASSALQSAKISRNQKTVRSPIEGKVTAINIKKGNLGTPGQILMKIEDLNSQKIVTSINKEEADLIHPGTKVEISDNNRIFIGTVSTINPTADDTSKKIRVEIAISKNHNLLNNSIVEITFKPITGKKIFVPLSSIILSDNLKFVRIVNEINEVSEIEVKTGNIIGSNIEVISGLSGNEKIIKSGSDFLEKGEKVIAQSNRPKIER